MWGGGGGWIEREDEVGSEERDGWIERKVEKGEKKWGRTLFVAPSSHTCYQINLL